MVRATLQRSCCQRSYRDSLIPWQRECCCRSDVLRHGSGHSWRRTRRDHGLPPSDRMTPLASGARSGCAGTRATPRVVECDGKRLRGVGGVGPEVFVSKRIVAEHLLPLLDQVCRRRRFGELTARENAERDKTRGVEAPRTAPIELVAHTGDSPSCVKTTAVGRARGITLAGRRRSCGEQAPPWHESHARMGGGDRMGSNEEIRAEPALRGSRYQLPSLGVARCRADSRPGRSEFRRHRRESTSSPGPSTGRCKRSPDPRPG